MSRVRLRVKILSAFGTALFIAIIPLALQADGTGAGANPEPPLSIVGAAQGLTFSAPKTAFQRQISIEATGDEVKDVKVLVAPLVASGTPPVPPSWTVDGKAGNLPFTVPKLGQVTLEIKADLPVAGTYTSAITLIDSKRRSTPLTVTRTRPAIPLQVLGLEKVKATSGNVAVWMSVQSTGDQTLQVQRPAVIKLSREEGDKSLVQADFDRLTVQEENDAAIKKPFDLAAREGKRLRLVFEGLSQAGTYVGKVRLAAADMEPVDADLSLVVKRGPVLAAILISLGVLISYLLRLYVVGLRPRLVRRRRLVGLLADLDTIIASIPGGLKGDEKAVADQLRHDLEDLDQDLGLGTERNADDVLDTFERKLPHFHRWIDLGRRVAVLEPPSLRQPLQSKLDEVKLALGKVSLADDEAKKADGFLDEVEKGIPAAVQKDLQDRITAFLQQIGQPSALTSPELKARMFAELKPRLEEIKTLADADRIYEARTKLQAARASYARLLAADLAATLKTAETPASYDKARWKVWQDDVQALLDQAQRETDPDRAIADYEAASLRFLAGISRAWLQEVEQAIQQVHGNKALTDAEKTERTTQLQAVADLLLSATTKAEANQLGDAAKDYAAAQEKLAPARQALRSSGVVMGGAAGAAAPTAPGQVPATAGGGLIFPLPPFSVRERPTVGALARRIYWSDSVFAFVILLIAVLLGLKVLWFDDPTWGETNDYLVAVLWGLGLHQISSGAAFEGVTALAERFQK